MYIGLKSVKSPCGLEFAGGSQAGTGFASGVGGEMLELKPRAANVTVVFDLDGTIADTAGDLIDSANAALSAEGFGIAPHHIIRPKAGYGARAMLEAALAAQGQAADAGQLERLTAKLLSHYEEHIAANTKFFPGFSEAARSLRMQGAKLALCTNKRERLALRLLSELGAGTLFDGIAGGDTFQFRKPDPRHIAGAVRLAGGDLSRAVMVGDSRPDVDAAKAAGIPVVAVGFGYAQEPPEELGADAIMHRFDELPALIHALLGGSGDALAAPPPRLCSGRRIPG